MIKTNIFILILFIGITIQALPNEASDSTFNAAKTYIRKSQPDAAIPLLLKIIEKTDSEETIIKANINLAEAYRQKVV